MTSFVALKRDNSSRTVQFISQCKRALIWIRSNVNARCNWYGSISDPHSFESIPVQTGSKWRHGCYAISKWLQEKKNHHTVRIDIDCAFFPISTIHLEILKKKTRVVKCQISLKFKGQRKIHWDLGCFWFCKFQSSSF